MGATLGEKEASRASAVAVLQALHEYHEIEELPIDVLMSEQKVLSVVAVGKVAESGVVLAPCVPKQTKVLDVSSHPHAVPIVVKSRMTPVGDTQIQTVHEFVVVPEFQKPGEGQPTAVAAGSQENPMWVWANTENEAESMNPFGAVRRMTDAQLSSANVEKPMTEPKLRFNCELVATSFSAVCAGVLHSKPIASTRMVEMQCLTNSVALEEGEELLLRLDAPAAKKKAGAKRTWMNASVDKRKREDRESAKRAKSAKPIDGIAV